MNTVTIIDNAATEISKVVTQYELQGASADALQSTFSPLFDKAKAWREEAAKIKVTSLAQTAEMGNARKARLEIRQVRIEAEKAKTRLKADSLRYGNAVQGAYNMILLLTEPVEQYLQDQEDYGKRLQEKQQAEARDLRQCEAGKYLEFFPQTIDLGTISDEEFARLLHYATTQWEAREAEKLKIENERKEKERKEAEEREALRAENERLRAAAAKHEAEVQRAYEAAIEAAKAIAAERAEVERLERAERERVAAENRAKMERDNAERERIRKMQEEREAAEKAALSASDKVKIEAIISDLKNISIPDFAVKGSKQRVFSLIFDLEIELLKIVE